MITNLRHLFFLLLAFGTTSAMAQAPNISYTTPQVYTAGTAITALVPTNTGGAVSTPTPVTLAAGFNNITGVSADASGNVYVAENGNNAIREIPAGGGSVLTLGSGFTHPTGVVVDASGNVYVVDNGNNALKEILAGTTTVTTLATGFNGPYGIAMDASRNIYVADASNNEIKEFLAGSSTAIILGSGFSHPTGVAVDAAGNVYVADRSNNLIKKIPVGGGAPVTLASGSGNPNGVAVDAAGNVYFADTNLSTVTEIPVGGGSNIAIGSGFVTPTAVYIDASGNIYVGDNGNTAVKKISKGGFTITPSLPAGLSFDAATGIISGTPTSANASTNYTVTAFNSSGSGSTVLNITVNLPAKPIISYTTPQVYTAATQIAPLSPVSSGGPIPPTGAFLISPGLPSGLSMDPNTGVISGTPTSASAATNYTITATNIGGSGTATLKITVNLPPKPIISYTTPQVYTATETITSLSPVISGGPIPPTGAFLISPGLPSGLSMDPNTGTISGTPTSASAATNYTITASNLGGSGTATLSITVNLPPKPVISYTSPQVYTATTAITPLSPVISGGPIPPTNAFLISPGLPSGLSMDPNTGIISGTPTAASPATSYTITASNLGGSGTATLKITVNLPPQPIISYSTPQVYNQFTTISSLSPVNSGGTVYPSGGYLISPALPSGLSMDPNTGIISGTPTVASAATNYTVTATNLGGSGTAVIKITVNPYPVPVISYSTPQTYVVGIGITPLSPTSIGVGAAGSTNIVTLASGFSNLTGVAVDGSGNVYVAENGNNAVREIPANGGATLTLGSGFIAPTGIAVDAAGNVYVADYGNGLVKKIPVGGGAIVTVGTGISGPYGLALDAAGNLYVGDFLANAVKKILAGTNTTVVIGSGFSSPTGVAVDAAGNVYVADRGNNAIKEILAGTGSTITLGSGNGNPNGVAVDPSGNVYFADTNSSVITEIPAGGGTPFTLGSGFVTPTAVAVDKTGSNIIYVGDNGNTSVKKITPAGGYFISPALPAGLSFSPITGTISGTPTTLSPATNYTVKAYNIGGFGSTNVNIAVTTAGLSKLTMSSGTLSPVFATAVNNYTASVTNGVSSITLTPTASTPTNTITVNGAAVASGTASPAIALAVGSNTVSIVVKTSGGSIIGNYTVVVTRAASANANLSGLSVSIGILSPAFASGTTSYTVNESNAVTSITVTPTLADLTATVLVNNQTVASGTSSPAISLSLGANTITVLVTAPDGTTTKSYTLTVTRDAATNNAYLSSLVISSGTLAPVFHYNTYSYTASVTNATTSVTVTPIVADANSAIKVNGTTVSSKTASGPIALAVGVNSITAVVTAPDDITTHTYTITVTRAPSSVATLSALATSSGILTPAFASGTTSYTASVATTTTSITVTPTTSDAAATVTVNGKAVTSGTASGAIALAIGANTITTIVTAPDGVTTDTYTLTVTRDAAGTDNAYLSSLVISSGTLAPAFHYNTYSYTASVTNATTSVTVTPVVADANSTIKVNGTTVSSKTASGPIALAVGVNSITAVVTAPDGITTHTYTITVTRAPSSVATLSALATSSGILTPAFASGTTSYTASVATTTTSITVTPTTSDAAATVTVNGKAVTSGTASGAIALAIGANTITTIVTAPDGVTTDTYTLTVTRDAAGTDNAYLSSLVISSGTLAPAFHYNTYSYTASVTNATTSVTVTPVVADANSTIKVNGTTVSSKTASGPIALAVGANAITAVVTAPDGITTHTYTITVTRAASGADSYDPGISVSKPTETPQLAEDGIQVHQGVSPNGDGINDFLQIDNISQYPDNKLSIMNRNGQLVFETQGYDNSSKVFDGHSNKNGQMQLPGTYFYQLDYAANGITKHKTGFIVLKY